MGFLSDILHDFAAPIGAIAGFALGGPAGAAIGGSLGGAISQSGANQNALDAQQAASANDLALRRYMYDTTRSDWAPQRALGTDAVTQLQQLLSSGQITSKFAGNVQNEPGFAFGLSQAQKAGERMAGKTSGGAGAVNSLNSFDLVGRYAADQYGNAFNRFQTERNNILNPLMGIAGFGNLANQQVGQAGQNYVSGAGENIQNLGNIQAASALNRGNIYGNVGNQLAAYYLNRMNAPKQVPWQTPTPGYDPYTPPTDYWGY